MPQNPSVPMKGASPQTKAPASRRTRILRAASVALAVLAVALLALAWFGDGAKGAYVEYRDFVELLERGEVAKAVIGADGTVSFELAETGSGGDGVEADASQTAPAKAPGGAGSAGGAAGSSADGYAVSSTGDSISGAADDPAGDLANGSAGSSAGDPAGSPIDGATRRTHALLGQGPFYTDNPQTPDFKERLLLAGVEVHEETDGAALFDAVLDLLFFGVFFGGIAFAASRFVSYNRTTFKIARKTGVSFNDIAGMDDLKRELGSVVEVLKDPRRFAQRGIRQIKGVVLEGPPGNGKTLFAKALATEAGVNFIATKGADFQSAFMSLGARKIRMLFSKAARHTPCIVFIDEFDSIGERRSYAGTGIDKENNRIITAMLNEMDGFTGRDGILVVAATNSYASLDAALVRPGRFDLRFTVGNPDYETRLRLLDLYTPGKNLAPDLTREALARAFDGMSCAAIESVLNEAASLALLEDAPTVTRAHVVEAVKRVGGGA